jgi:hypothetical protein
MIGRYPDFTPLDLTDRDELDPLFRALPEGLSELTFAGIFCFAGPHTYLATRLPDGPVIFSGSEQGQNPFFLAPFALPAPALLDELLARFPSLKLATPAQAERLAALGYAVTEDRDNFDYLYRREDLAQLPGRALQKKRNLVHRFLKDCDHEAKPLTPDLVPDALVVLEAWRDHYKNEADYLPARIALANLATLALQGRMVYANGQPAGFSLGEPCALGTSFVVHYEKALPWVKGLSQFVTLEFAASLPATYEWINREQDVGDPGLRQAKLTYRPAGYVKKFRVRQA